MASKRNAWVSRIAIAVVVVAVCFWIARSLGREAVEKLCSKTGLATIERFFERHGDQSVLIARLLPFVSFDFVSYFAGLTSMSFKGFMIATGIGQLPATIVYSYVGGMLTGGTKMLFTALLILFALAALAVLARQLYREHASRGKEGADAALVLMLCQAMSNLRVRFRHISYGDQGLFIERDLFFKAGMFPDVPLMEDFQFALNLKRLGEPLGMTKHRIRTSARRFPDGEVNRLRVWVNMARLRSRYVKGASPEELALAYGNVRWMFVGGVHVATAVRRPFS